MTDMMEVTALLHVVSKAVQIMTKVPPSPKQQIKLQQSRGYKSISKKVYGQPKGAMMQHLGVYPLPSFMG